MSGGILIPGDFGRLKPYGTTVPATSHVPFYNPVDKKAYYATPDQIAQGESETTDWQQFVGIDNILLASAGTFTITRIARGNYVYRHTAAANVPIIGIDLLPMIRTTASKGLKLTSIDVIYSIGTLALNSHTYTLDLVNYANNAAVTITNTPATGSLATATQTNPYLTNVVITTPAYDNTADSKYIFELTADCASSTAYDFYGLNLRFTRSGR